MLRPMPASEQDSATQSSRAQQHNLQHSGPYGLVDGDDEAAGEADDSQRQSQMADGDSDPGAGPLQVSLILT